MRPNAGLQYPAGVKSINSIYLRFFLPFSISLILATSLAWLIATSLLTDSLEQRLEDKLRHATSVMAEGAFPFTQEVLQRLARLLDADFVLIRTDGEVGRSTLPEHRTGIRDAVKTTWQQPHRRDGSLILNLSSEPFALVFQTLPEGRNEPYAMVAAVGSLADVYATARRTGWWLASAALLGTLVLAWVGHRLTRGLSLPIAELATMADRIASGDRSVRVAPVNGIHEIGALADALNRMTVRLQDYEQEVADQNRLAALGEMAARVAHEIRNPLTAIKLQVQLLGEAFEDDQERARVNGLLDEIRRLELVVSGTLAVARPAQLKLGDTDLNALIREVGSLMEPQLAHRQILLEIVLGELPAAALDADRIKQVIFNLLTNAADELSAGGTIRVATEFIAAENRISLCVEDSGSGIAPQLRDALFNRMAGTKPSGLGVGLLLSKELIELHHGTIEADSSPALGGARFTIRFPVQIINHG